MSAPPSTIRCQGAQRGVPRSGLWSEAEIASSGTGSERAEVASVAERKPPASTWHRKAYEEKSPGFSTGLPSVSRCRQGGFTLLELIVVLVLAGLVAALVAPSFSGTLESARLRSGAAEVRSVLTLARTLAASGSKVRAVSFDVEKGEFAVLGEARRYLLPEGVRIESARVGGAVVEEETFRVRFFPDGSAEEAEIVVSSASGGGIRVTVEPLTGIAEAMS
ncbi:MAG: prepilin-type N-terminal cleavage/methylation domain-containing protein [Deltaproteobacteria bacterium]|nr:prepilin-type N-terminal cleavage/methylation domain-containing protein [Deltaproteobacteria bacterium]MDH3384038.1 prepilin-type N-terminal cleavage/methylation domain-containing protein [Deltaproteobacteria bacterium]